MYCSRDGCSGPCSFHLHVFWGGIDHQPARCLFDELFIAVHYPGSGSNIAFSQMFMHEIFGHLPSIHLQEARLHHCRPVRRTFEETSTAAVPTEHSGPQIGTHVGFLGTKQHVMRSSCAAFVMKCLVNSHRLTFHCRSLCCLVCRSLYAIFFPSGYQAESSSFHDKRDHKLRRTPHRSWAIQTRGTAAEF